MSAPTMAKNRTLLNQLDKEEKLRMIQDRSFDVPDYRTGDVVKFSLLSSQSEKKVQEFSGVVFGKKAARSIRANCKIVFGAEGVNV